MKISGAKRAHLVALCDDITDRHAEEARPYVCPGCHRADIPCASWCPDAAIEHDREHDRETREMYGDDEEPDAWDDWEAERRDGRAA